MTHFLHSSDWQLGMTRHYLSREAQARFTGDRINVIRRIGALAGQCGAQFIVVAGDVFEHANLPRVDLARALAAMGEVGVPIYLLPGNHDPLGASSIYRSQQFVSDKPASVHVLDRVGATPVADRVELLAAPWFGKHPESDPVADALSGVEADGTTRILVGHGMLSGITFGDDESASEVRREPLEQALAAGVIHYVALGDRHIRWPADGLGPIQYSGSPESTSFHEPEPGQVLEVTIDNGRPAVTAHPVGRWRHVRIERDVCTDADLDQLEAQFAGLPSKECTIVKHALRGTLNLRQSARLDALLERYGEVFASLAPWQRHSDIAVLPDGTEYDELPVTGYLRRAVDQLQDASRRGDDDATGALKLLHRLASPTFAGGTR